MPVSALRRPLRRYALSVDEPPQSAVSASAAESECGSQSSLALDLHGSGACAGITLRVRDNTRRRPLARQQRLRDDTLHPTPVASVNNINNIEESTFRTEEEDVSKNHLETLHLCVEQEERARSAPPAPTAPPSPPPSPRLVVTSPCPDPATPPETCITIEPSQDNSEDPPLTDQ